MSRIENLTERAYYNGQNSNHCEIIEYEGYLKTANEPSRMIRRAKIEEYIFEHYPVEIDPEELLVGRFSNAKKTDQEIKQLDEVNQFLLKTEPLKKRLGYFVGVSGILAARTGHRAMDFEKLLSKGVKGVLEEIDDYEGQLRKNDGEYDDKASFYKAARISLNGLLKFASRYKDELTRLYSTEENPVRKAEYQRLVQIFERVPYLPAEDFYEAMQSMWFVQFALHVADDNTLNGRPDNYFYPYYQKGIEDGSLTKEFAMELIESLYLKTNEIYNNWPVSLMVGGVDREGKPVCNALTEMFILAIEKVKLINPSVSLCYNEHIPDRILEHCVDILGKGYTRPSIFNDKLIIKALENIGVSAKDARYYIHSSCVEITPIASSYIFVAHPYINPIKGIEMILNHGKEMLTGDGESGAFNPGIAFDLNALESFQAFYDAYKLMLSGMIAKAIEIENDKSEARAKLGSTPLMSCFTDDCIKSGKDSATGGAKYNYIYPDFPGFSSAIDALNAIKDTVYVQKLVSLSELKEILLRNFEGKEDFRQYLLNRAPKYGNDIVEADEIAVDLYEFINEELKKYKNCLGGTYHPGYFAWIMHGKLGENTAASSDGRRAREALSECLGPVRGMERQGPTAALNSLTKMDHTYGLGGIAANFRFTKGLLDSREGKKAVFDFIKEAMNKGCFEVQLNVVDQETLLKAKKNPEAYRTLMVRVAGYSDYFVNLAPNIQDEVISRIEHGSI